MCKLLLPSNLSTVESFKNFITSHLMHLLRTSFDADYTHTWSMIRTCPCHHYKLLHFSFFHLLIDLLTF